MTQKCSHFCTKNHPQKTTKKHLLLNVMEPTSFDECFKESANYGAPKKHSKITYIYHIKKHKNTKFSGSWGSWDTKGFDSRPFFCFFPLHYPMGGPGRKTSSSNAHALADESSVVAAINASNSADRGGEAHKPMRDWFWVFRCLGPCKNTLFSHAAKNIGFRKNARRLGDTLI